MNVNDFEVFRDVLHGVHDFYDRQPSAFAIDVWWQALQPYDLKAITRAFSMHTVNPDTGQFMPKPADIVRMISGGTNDNAIQAWSKVDKALRSVGVYESIVFDDPVIHRTLEDMGGWIMLGMKSEDEWPFVAREFETRYRGYAMRRECGDYQRVMIGLNEAQNAKNNFKVLPPLLGLPVQRLNRPELKVLKGGKNAS